MVARVSSGSRETVIQSQIGKLTECDENLSLIASEMTRLQDELTQFRTDADRLAQLLAEQEASLDEKELALSRLEEERTLEQQQADRVSAELREAGARLSRRDQQVAMLEQELQALRTRIADRERRLADAAAELSDVQDALAERERTLEDSIAENPIAGHVRFIASPAGYSLYDSDEHCPGTGELVAIAGSHFLVARSGRSPLPGDARPCAFLVPVRT